MRARETCEELERTLGMLVICQQSVEDEIIQKAEELKERSSEIFLTVGQQGASPSMECGARDTGQGVWDL